VSKSRWTPSGPSPATSRAYGGRKNLILDFLVVPSDHCPRCDGPPQPAFEGTRNYEAQVVSVTNALADAKVAVYPVNPSGVQTQGYFDVATRRSTAFYGPTGNTEKNAMNRESEARFAAQESMEEVAQQTGGKICVNNNDSPTASKPPSLRAPPTTKSLIIPMPPTGAESSIRL